MPIDFQFNHSCEEPFDKELQPGLTYRTFVTPVSAQSGCGEKHSPDRRFRAVICASAFMPSPSNRGEMATAPACYVELTQFLRYRAKHQRGLQRLRAERRLRLRPGGPLNDHQILRLIDHNHLAEDPQRPQGMLEGCLRGRFYVDRIHRHFVVPPLEAVDAVRMRRRYRARRPRQLDDWATQSAGKICLPLGNVPLCRMNSPKRPQSSSVALNPCAPTSCWPLA